MNAKLIEDDIRRMFQANKSMSELSHRRRDLGWFYRQFEWSIHLEPNCTADGSEFILKRNGLPFSSDHMSWDSAYQAIPENIRNDKH
jgi:hypothetical protein